VKSPVLSLRDLGGRTDPTSATVLLRESVLVWGGLSRPQPHKAIAENLRIHAKTNATLTRAGAEPLPPPIDDARLTIFVANQFQAERVVTDKLQNGELVAAGYEPGGRGRGSEPIVIPAARWCTLQPDFEGSRALDGDTIIATGIVVSVAAAAQNAPQEQVPHSGKQRSSGDVGREMIATLRGLLDKGLRPKSVKEAHRTVLDVRPDLKAATHGNSIGAFGNNVRKSKVLLAK
jgi:hypothetical protein